MLTLTQWFDTYKNTAILVPSGGAGNDGQCLQAMDSFIHEVYGTPYIYTPGAIDVWYKSLLDAHGFVKVMPGAAVLPGDLLFYDGIAPKPGGGFYGHVSIASRGGTYGDFWAYDSNWGGQAFLNSKWQPVLHESRHNDGYNKYITGYYRFAGGGRGSGTLTNGAAMPTITDAELKDFQSWKEKGMYYENKLVPAMQADKVQWVKNFDTVKAELQALLNKPSEVVVKEIPKIIERCTVDLTDMPVEESKGLVALVKGWLTGTKK